MLRSLLAVLLALPASLAAPASAQTRAVEVRAPSAGLGASAISLVAPAPASLAPSALTPSLALSLTPSAIPAPVPLAATIKPAAATPERLAALTAGVARAAASIGDKDATPNSLASSGRDVEALLTGALAPASAPEAADPAVSFVLDASRSLASRADDLGESRGLKAATMSGGDFVGLLESAAASAPRGPTPAATAAAREVATALVRVSRALIPADQPLKPALPRALAVWQVFDQEMRLAAEKGGLDAIAADARLFADQVEASVAPAPAPVLSPAPKPEERPALAPSPHPEDPEGYKEIGEEGSVFGWKPIETSPGHGLPLVDKLIRRILSDKDGPHAEGFVLPGSAKSEKAKIFLYGERHTDGGLISENMRRIVADAKPGRPMIVLVEGYTGWSLRGYEALRYLAARGLDPKWLEDKGVPGAGVEVRGWDTSMNYDASKHPLLQHHMDLLELNRLAHSELRGLKYYAAMLRAGWTAFKSFQDLWKAAIVARNADLDAAVRGAAADADEDGGTVHVIAGTDHLLRDPRLARVMPRALRPSLRKAIGGRPWRASQPAHTVP